MFTKFFYDLRASGLKVTMSEFITLQEALDKGMCNSSLTEFYYLARMIMVKSETESGRRAAIRPCRPLLRFNQ